MVVYGGPEITTSGLVLYLDAGNSKSYPGTGTTWNDLSGNNRNGTLTNSPSFNTANKGIIDFDGVNDTINISPFVSPVIYTVFCVFKINGTQPTNGSVILGKRTAGCYDSAIYLNGTSSPSLTSYKAGPEQVIKSNMPNNTWHHLCVLRKSSGTDFYLNGVYTTGYASIFNNNQLIENIGSSCTSVNPFLGSIALLQCYSYEFSAIEIKQNYNALKGRYGL